MIFPPRCVGGNLFGEVSAVSCPSEYCVHSAYSNPYAVTPLIKATLLLSYDFLRLYVNAFAFQAALNRAIAQARTSPNTALPMGPLFDLAGTFDARFIYEAIDAANSLLGTLNSFIDPAEGLKYMPLKYYLYVIYAAVFLFKVQPLVIDTLCSANIQS